MIFVDTNYFLRFLLKDNKSQYLQVKNLFLEAAQGKIELISSSTVFFEIHFVLKSFYKKDKLFLIEILTEILNLSVVFPEKQLLQESTRLWEKSAVSLEDCYNIAFSRVIGAEEFKTFDEKLQKVAKALLEKETLESDEFESIVGKKKDLH